MKIYIAGKITGDENYKAKFRAAESDLAACGDIVINPSVLPAGLSNADYMRLCFAMMEVADTVLFLPDYEESPGALLEWSWCQYIGKQTAYYAHRFGGGGK